MKFFLQLYLQGLILLFAAIVANVLATKLGLPSWYDFFAQKNIKAYEWMWLIFGYPLVLGFVMWVIQQF